MPSKKKTCGQARKAKKEEEEAKQQAASRSDIRIVASGS
jgi:hypothetical protein